MSRDREQAAAERQMVEELYAFTLPKGAEGAWIREAMERRFLGVAWDWPDGKARRLILGHRDERDVPGYCTCGEATIHCPHEPRAWSVERAWE